MYIRKTAQFGDSKLGTEASVHACLLRQLTVRSGLGSIAFVGLAMHLWLQKVFITLVFN